MWPFSNKQDSMWINSPESFLEKTVVVNVVP